MFTDPILETLQRLLDSELLQRNHIFYLLIKNAVLYAQSRLENSSDFEWDSEILQFVETIEFHGHESVLNLLRGPGHLGEGRGGSKSFDWKTWNLPLPAAPTRKKNSRAYTTKCGTHKHLLRAFLELAKKLQLPAFIDNPSVYVIPVVAMGDGMQLKPGMQFDVTQGYIVGTNEDINLAFIKNNPNPKGEFLKKIFIKEADVCILNSLDCKLHLPVGVDYLTSMTGEETKSLFTRRIKEAQVCLECLPFVETCQNIIKISHDTCLSKCDECLTGRAVCEDCLKDGHRSIQPALRACKRCIDVQKQCFKLAVLFYSSDSESKNKSAGEILNQEKADNQHDPEMSLSTCIPDAVHVGKRYRQQLSNWFLLVSGYRINIVLLRTLKQDPQVKNELHCLRVAAVRNRDRMDVDTLLEISSEDVLKVLSSHKTIVQTLVPEKYRLYEGNKKGVLRSPTAVCLGPYGKLLVADAGKGTLLSARLHYPVDVTELAKGLNLPMSVDYTDGIAVVAESAGDRIAVLDLEGKLLLNPSQMNVRQLEAALKERAALPSGRRPKRAQLVAALKKWIDENRSKGTSSLSAESGLSVVKCNINLHRPSAVCFAPVADVPLRLLVGCADGMLVCLKIGSDGLVISGTTLFKTALHSVPLSGLAYCDEGLFITSPCPHNGGIFHLPIFDRSNGVLPKTIVKNGSPTCGTAHGVCVTKDKKVVFTDTAEKKIKSLDFESREVNVVAGTGQTGTSDGSKGTASFNQPTGLCIEGNSLFVVDSSSAQLKLITSMLPLKEILNHLSVLLKTFGVHFPGQQRDVYSLGDGIARLNSVNTFLENCIREAREVSDFQGQPSGPNGTMSLQTMSDIQRLLNSLIELNAMVTEENPAFLPEVDLHSLLTLLVENLFAEMRGGSTDTPQVLDFARRFSSSSRELMKRLSKCSFNYFTSTKSYYSRPHCAISFKDLLKCLNWQKTNFLLQLWLKCGNGDSSTDKVFDNKACAT